MNERNEKETMVCGYCGEKRISKHRDGTTYCITGCYNTDIISWSDFCEKDNYAREWACKEAHAVMREEHKNLIYEGDNGRKYTDKGQNIFNELFDDLYHEYMMLN